VIKHVLATESGLLTDILRNDLGVELSVSQWLLKFGAVYLNKERITEDVLIKKQDYLRVHCEPRRYPIENINWQERIVFSDEAYLFVNKPAGLPTHATSSNLHENVISQINFHLRLNTSVTHRLDVAASGLLCLAKNKAAASQFNKALLAGKMKKIYRATVEGNCRQRGELTHYMESGNFQPKNISEQPKEAWLECRLLILSGEAKEENTQLEIQLLTGRTHQIRAQLSALGHPIVGDKLYGAKKMWGEKEEISLTSSCLQFTTDKLYDIRIS
jgi:23S rRNA pseudouridine1911/1915/1917 synthase